MAEAEERERFLRDLQPTNPRFLNQAGLFLDHAPSPLNSVSYLRNVFNAQNGTVQLLKDLRDKIPPEGLEPLTPTNTMHCDFWNFCGEVLMLQGKMHQAVEVHEALYTEILSRQIATRKRFHKGLPLFQISQCYQHLGRMVHAKRYMMLTLCEDAVSGEGLPDLQTSFSYGKLAWEYGLSDRQIREYAEQAYDAFRKNTSDGAMPEWLLQEFDQQWKTEIPSGQEAGTYHITECYCEQLIDQIGGGDGKPLERLAEYLVGAMPGCRVYRRGGTFSTDYDVVASVDGTIVDFRSELGRYFVCECKAYRNKKADFTDVAKFCRVLDSVKAKFGIIFSPNGHSGERKARNADREVLKIYQDRGMVIVVVNREDLHRVAKGDNLISILRQKYEDVRLDLRRSLV